MGETHRNQVFKPSAQRGCGIGRWHIKPKNLVSVPMADHLLTDDEQNALFDAFARIEANEMGPGVHERYHAMIGAYQKQVAEWNKMPV
jgi:hemerythrin-like domain-containing protein